MIALTALEKPGQEDRETTEFSDWSQNFARQFLPN